MTDLTVTASHDGTVRHLCLPGGRLSAGQAAHVVAIAEAWSEERSVRVVVVRAEGQTFCEGPADDLEPLSFEVDPAAALARLRPPVVVAIRGACHSVGLELALAGDLRLAEPGATFQLGDLASGRLPCWGGTQRLPRAVGQARATAMLLLGTTLNAAEAFSAGLLAAPPLPDLDLALQQALEQLLSVGPLALELAKEAVHRGSELPLRDGLRLEGDLNHLLASTADRAEGLAAFFAKRPADFAGR